MSIPPDPKRLGFVGKLFNDRRILCEIGVTTFFSLHRAVRALNIFISISLHTNSFAFVFLVPFFNNYSHSTIVL